MSGQALVGDILIQPYATERGIGVLWRGSDDTLWAITGCCGGALWCQVEGSLPWKCAVYNEFRHEGVKQAGNIASYFTLSREYTKPTLEELLKWIKTWTEVSSSDG